VGGRTNFFEADVQGGEFPLSCVESILDGWATQGPAHSVATWPTEGEGPLFQRAFGRATAGAFWQVIVPPFLGERRDLVQPDEFAH